MKHKRRIKKLYQRECDAKKRFPFKKTESICVSAVLSSDIRTAKILLSSLSRQSFRFSELILLCENEKINKLAREAAASNNRIIPVDSHEELKNAEVNTACDILFRVTAPIPDHVLFKLETSVLLHPQANAFYDTTVFEGETYELKAYRVEAFRTHISDPSYAWDFTPFGHRVYNGDLTSTAKENAKNTKICAGMVLFNPDIEHSAKNAEVILPQVEHLFFVDNGSANIDEFAARFSSNEKVTIIRNGENKGIAFALNKILDAAYENGYDWVLTLDQDTICDSNMISVYNRYIHIPGAGIISPYIIHRGNKTLEEYQNEPNYETDFVFDFDRCITSASLTNVKAAKEVGGFNDELFIDAVDFDINQKLLMNGYFIIKANDTYIIQEIGKRTPIKLFNLIYKVTRISKFKTVRYFSVHSDFRLYYIARNYKWFLRKYNVTSPTVNRWANFKDMVLRFMLYPKSRSRIKMFKTVRKGHRDSKKMTY